MIEAFGIMINGTWALLSINIPISETIHFTLWQYFMFIIFLIVLVKQITKNTGGGASD